MEEEEKRNEILQLKKEELENIAKKEELTRVTVINRSDIFTNENTSNPIKDEDLNEINQNSIVRKNIEDKVRQRMKDGKSPLPDEVTIYQMINANYLNATDKKLKEINKHINNIPFIDFSEKASRLRMSEGDYKRMEIDNALKARNELLKTVINKLAEMDIPHLFEDVLGSKTYVSPEQKGKGVFFDDGNNTFKIKDNGWQHFR